MNTFWLKIAGVAVAAVLVIIIIGAVLPSGNNALAPPTQTKTIYDVAAEDRQKYLAPPQPAESNNQKPQGASGPQTPAQTNTAPHPTTQPKRKTITLYFSELSEIEQIEAQRYLNVAVPGRSIGRMPLTSYNLMVENCRRIIERWPDSWYAYRAKQMLRDMPERFRPRYHITDEELDLSRFEQPRPGTKPYEVEVTE